ncbi:hypothetical protein U1Q18_011666 [Sarracenia purpurea var. burkii]
MERKEKDPEHIFYGQNSGVVGVSRSELHQTFHAQDVLHCGYDKEMKDTILHLYGTDALKDVSSYQQKFCRISSFLDELPSPTPSEGSDNGDEDIGGEISSSSIVGGVQTLVAPALAQSIVSSPSHVDALDLNQRVLPMFNTESKVDGFGETTISWKQKLVKDPILDGLH